MTVESLKSFFDVGALILLFLVFAFGAGVFITGNVINDRQAEKLRRFAKDLKDKDVNIAEARTEQVRLDTKLAQAVADAKGADARIAEAQRGSAEANEKALKAQQSLASAEQHAKEADAKAEGFRLDIAKANERAADANRTAEQERLARLQLEARLADRVVTPQQQARIVAGLRSIGKRTADITIFGDTPEISIFSGALLECFTKAEWSLNISRPGGGGSYARGVLVGVRIGSPSEYTQASNLVITVLRESVGNGIGPWEFDKLTGGGLFSANGSVGTPTPAGESPLRIVIGSK
jgi:hypothetical protein